MPLPAGFGTLPAIQTYVCAGHGKWRPSFGRFVVPGNMTLLFWVHHGEALTNGTEIEDLLMSVNEDVYGLHGYNRDVRTLATPQTLASFRAPDNASLAGAGNRSRNGLPEVIGPHDECYNYELSYDNVVFFGITNNKMNLMREFDTYPAADNMILARPLQPPRMLRDIVREVNTNRSVSRQLHWAACRAIDLA